MKLAVSLFITMATMEAPAQTQPASPGPAERRPFAERRAAATKLVSESGAEVSVAYRSTGFFTPRAR
jgi:hypothetical protein